jgi:hypothetical protein
MTIATPSSQIGLPGLDGILDAANPSGKRIFASPDYFGCSARASSFSRKSSTLPTDGTGSGTSETSAHCNSASRRPRRVPAKCNSAFDWSTEWPAQPFTFHDPARARQRSRNGAYRPDRAAAVPPWPLRSAGGAAVDDGSRLRLRRVVARGIEMARPRARSRWRHSSPCQSSGPSSRLRRSSLADSLSALRRSCWGGMYSLR